MSPRAMTRYVFREIKRRAVKRVPCGTCGKSVQRSRTFMQTLNPWNKNAAGEPASEWEIQDKLAVEVATWQAAPDYCTPCLRAVLR